MKCPECGDTEYQRYWLVPEELNQTGYRCAKCGRLYATTLIVAPASVRVTKSGISNLLTVDDSGAGTELRQWLQGQGCRVGPLFEPTAGRFAFFVYSRRDRVVPLIGQHGRFRVEAS